MTKNYSFQKISIFFLFFIGLMNINAQTYTIEQTELTTGWSRQIISGENISFPAAAQTASTFSFIIKNTGATQLLLNGVPKVQISGTNATEFTCSIPTSSILNAGQSATFTVTYLPTGLGLRTALLQIPNNLGTPFQINLKGASFDFYGPRSSVPSGTASVDATAGSNGSFGRTGGGNIRVNAVTFGEQTNLYWGPKLSSTGDLAVKVSMNDSGVYQNNENLTFDASTSNLPNGIVVWKGSTTIQNAITSSLVPVFIRATMITTWFNGSTYSPAALIDPVTLGLSSQIGGLIQFDQLTDYLNANILIEASLNGVNGWTPYLNFYDAYPTPPGPLPGAGIGSAYSTFSPGFYWNNLDPSLTQNSILNVNEGATATITTSQLNATDLEDLALAYGNKSNIIFKVITDNNGLATNFGRGNLKLDGVSLAQNSTFTLQNIEDGKLTYTHDGSETNYDEFLFSFVDSKKELGDDAGHTTYNFRINVLPVNDTPVANNLNFSSSYAAPLNETLTASDADSSVLTYSIVSNPTSGTITNFNATTGTFTYTTTLGAPGTDSFTYQVSDGNSTSAIRTVNIAIINLPPTSQNVSLLTEEDKPLTGTLTASDPENGTISFQIDKQPNHGTLALNASGNYTYTPSPSRFGYDSFLFSVKDQQNNVSVSYKAIINIIPRIDPGDALVVDKDLIRLFDPVTAQDTIITKRQGLQDALNVVYKKNVGLFAYDKTNGLIKIDPSTGNQTLVKAASNFTSSGPIGGPTGMIINSDSKILVADGTRILEVDPITTNISILFSGGLISFPTGIALLKNGDLIITDAAKILGGSSNLIRITPQGIQSIVSTGNLMTLPLDLAIVNDNKIVISDAGSFAGATDNIYTIDLTTGVQTLLSTGGNISVPSGLDFWNNNVFVVNKEGSKQVIKIDVNTGVQSVVPANILSEPWGLFTVQNGITIENLLATDASCPNAVDGSIDFTINGGTAPYYYSLDGGSEVEITSLPVSIPNLKAKNYSLFIRDNTGNDINTNVSVNAIPDTVDPTITAPQTVTVSADNGSCVATNVVLGTPIAADNCTGFSVTNDAPSNLSFPIGTTVVTWTITDASNHTATATQNIIVEDNQKPQITAPQAVSVSADIDSCFATNVTLGIATASDNCTGFVITNDKPISFPIGTTLVTWTATDASGNKTTATQNITVLDTQKPVITPPQAVSVSADVDSCVATNVALGTASASDNCTGFIITNDKPLSFPIGTTVVTWTVTDASGNKATATQNITVLDTQIPIITAPQNVTVSADVDSCIAANVSLGTAIASDNCAGFVITNNKPSSFPLGTTMVTWTVTDAAGNKAIATQNVIVRDTQKPIITAPQAVSVSADADSCVAANVTIGTSTASDNCTGFVITNNKPANFPIGTTVVTWTVTDAAGNKATATQNVIVRDTQSPVIIAPQNVTVPTDNGACVATNVSLGTATASDNCTGFVVTNNKPANFPVGSTIVTWTVTDAAGNKATATQTITVTGLIAPNVPTSQNYCKGALVSDLETNGFTINWYNSQTGSIVLPKTISLTNGIYYAANFNDQCESKSRTAVSVQISTATPPTGNSIQSFCDGVTLNDIVVSGTNVKWYASKSSANPLPLTTPLKDQIKYYASQTDISTGCESSERLEVVASVKKVLAPQGKQSYILCTKSNTTLAEINKNYSDVIWFDSTSRTNRLNNDYELMNGDIIYGVSFDSQSGCESIEDIAVSIQILDCELEIFNYITPDNNNQNDVLVITNIEAFPKNNLQVFNREGKAVFKISGYGQDNKYFMGASNINGENTKLPTGTYFYVLEYFSPITNKSESKKGFLYINNND